jgi:hypothetical protein
MFGRTSTKLNEIRRDGIDQNNNVLKCFASSSWLAVTDRQLHSIAIKINFHIEIGI